jgi:hypothetical protein
VVDKSKKGNSRDADIRIREEKESINRFGLRDNENIIDSNTNAKNNKIKEISIVEPNSISRGTTE